MTALHNKGMHIMQYVCFSMLIICAYYQIIQNQTEIIPRQQEEMQPII